MFDIELLRGYYSGNNIKVAIIDTGCNIIENKNVLHYHYSSEENCILPDYNKKISDSHGTICGNRILEVAPDITLIDINVLNEEGNITEDGVNKAIEFAIDKSVDIISISLGFSIYSFKLDDNCRKAYENNIFIAAASSMAVSFPADNKYAIKILYDSEHNFIEKIEKCSSGTYLVSCPPYDKDIYTEVEGRYAKSDPIVGSSVSCAYFAGILALYLESRPFIKRDFILQGIFSIAENNRSIEKEVTYDEPIIIKEKSLFYVISSNYNIDCTRYKEILNNNIIGYYDLLNDKIDVIDVNSDISKINNLVIVNPLSYNRTKLSNSKFKNTQYIGNFDNYYHYGRTLKNDKVLRDISTPIILIAGIGMECGKFNVQLELKKQMTENKLLNYNITYNPLGYIFDMDVLDYPENITFPDIVYNINNSVRNIEDSGKDYESIIINVAGSMMPLNKVNTNNFGILYHSYITTVPIDYIIMCVNSMINHSIIEKKINELHLLGIYNISIIISDLTYDSTTLTNIDKITPYLENESVILENVSQYKKIFPDVSVYSFNDVKNGDLFNTIVNNLT